MTAVGTQVSLTVDELALLIELLEREHGQLPTEIHHTRTRAMRERLHQRVNTVEALLDRLRAVAAGPPELQRTASGS